MLFIHYSLKTYQKVMYTKCLNFSENTYSSSYNSRILTFMLENFHICKFDFDPMILVSSHI